MAAFLSDPADDLLLELALEAMTVPEFLRQEAARGKREDFEQFLDAVPDVPPDPSDL